MSNEYNPAVCDHKIPDGPYKGFSAFCFESLSSVSGEDLNYVQNVSVCKFCGDIHIIGHKLMDGKIHHFNEIISIHHPDAVASIVKAANFYNASSKDYSPFIQKVPQDEKTLRDQLDLLLEKYFTGVFFRNRFLNELLSTFTLTRK